MKHIFVSLVLAQLLFAGEYLDINISPASDTIDEGDTAIFELTLTPKSGFNADVDLQTTCGILSPRSIGPPVEEEVIRLYVTASSLNNPEDTVDTVINIIGKNGTTLLDSVVCYIRYTGYTGTIYNYEWITYTTADGLAGWMVYAIAIDGEGNKWFGTQEGVSKFDGINWTTYDTSNSGLVDNFVHAIAIDSEGNKWFGTRGGVSKFDGKFWTTYNSSDGLADNEVRAIAIDSEGNKWFGTRGGA